MTQKHILFQGDRQIAAADNKALINRVASSDQKRITCMVLEKGLTPGANNVFRARYRATGGTATFTDRDIVVIPI